MKFHTVALAGVAIGATFIRGSQAEAGACDAATDCGGYKKCTSDDEKCSCEYKKCRKIGKDCKTSGNEWEMQYWSCPVWKECRGKLNSKGSLKKWGNCKPLSPPATSPPTPSPTTKTTCPSTVTFQDYNSIVYAQSNSLDGSPTYTAVVAQDEQNDGILSTFGGVPIYTDNVKISPVPGMDDRLFVKFSLFTYGGVPFDIPTQFSAIEDGTLFLPEVLLFDIGNVFGAPVTGDFGPANDGIDIGQPWMPADSPNNAFLTWYFPDGSRESSVIPNILNLVDSDPNSLEIQYFMLIDETAFSYGDAIGFTITEEIILF